jgi:hypothetical protein
MDYEYHSENAKKHVEKLVEKLFGEDVPSDERALIEVLLERYNGVDKDCSSELHWFKLEDYAKLLEKVMMEPDAHRRMTESAEFKECYGRHTATSGLFSREYMRRSMSGLLMCFDEQLTKAMSENPPQNPKELISIAKKVFNNFTGPCPECFAKYPYPDTRTPKYATCKDCGLIGEHDVTFEQFCMMTGVDLTLALLATRRKNQEFGDELSDEELGNVNHVPAPFPMPAPPVACHRTCIRGLTDAHMPGFYYYTYCSACGRRTPDVQKEEVSRVLEEMDYAIQVCGLTTTQ